MIKKNKKIKFETLVIICGIFQSILLLFTIITKLEIFLLLILFFQNFVYLNVTRRFVRIIRRDKNNENEKINKL